MSDIRFYVKQGLVQKARAKILGAFDLNRFFKWSADKYSIPYVDLCCDSAKTILPIRYNITTGSLEYVSVAGVGTLYVKKPVASAINSTNTATAAQVATGLITSTSGAATSITLPTATQLATQLGAVRGSHFEFIVDNTAGANTVTMIAGSGITVASALTGGTTLTVPATTSGIAIFRVTFASTIAATLARIV